MGGCIVAVGADGARPPGLYKPHPAVAARKPVEKMRPEPNEIIIATGLKLRTYDIQLQSATAAWGNLLARRQD